jgi:iron complex transport system substrate-binding protein
MTRRSLLAASAGLLAMPHVARAATGVVDAAGRSVTVPERVERVFPAGPPAAITHYTLQPRTLLGWPRANRPAELAFLDPEVGARSELGRLTGARQYHQSRSAAAVEAGPDLRYRLDRTHLCRDR